MSACIEFEARHRFPSGFQLDASFSSDARVTALFGPSGSGKSSVLAIIAGLLSADQARVRVAQRTLCEGGTQLAPERRGVGFVPQDALLFPHLDVAANLRYGARRRARGQRATPRGSAAQIDVGRVLEVLELQGLVGARPDELSGGQRQRVALGRALLAEPELLLLDEPLTGLEEDLRDRILGYVERVVAEWGLRTLVVSHDQVAVRRLADRVVVLEAGRVVDQGEALPTLDRAVLGAAGSTGPMNLVRVSSPERRGGRLVGVIGDQELHLPGEAPLAAEAALVHVRFLASDVALARGDISGLSMRNHVRGRVERVEPDASAERAFVAVAVGDQRFWAELTLDAVSELELRPGVDVVCFVKTRAMRVSG